MNVKSYKKKSIFIIAVYQRRFSRRGGWVCSRRPSFSFTSMTGAIDTKIKITGIFRFSFPLRANRFESRPRRGRATGTYRRRVPDRDVFFDRGLGCPQAVEATPSDSVTTLVAGIEKERSWTRERASPWSVPDFCRARGRLEIGRFVLRLRGIRSSPNSPLDGSNT